LIIELYVASGKLTWKGIPDGKPEDVAAPTRVSLGAVGVKGAELPEWISEERLSSSDKIGAEFMAEYLADDRPTMLGLKELAEHRRAEVRTLAVRSLAMLGEFDPLIDALNQNDPALKTTWETLVLDLRAAIARGPATASAVRQALQEQRGEMAAPLYRMLWGYTNADLKAGADVQLVEFLDHNDHDARSLAFWNLKNITGLTLSYFPHMTADSRRIPIQKWKQRQASGQIVLKTDEPSKAAEK